MNRKDLSKELHKKGYNCAQCVTCTFNDVLDGDPKTIFKLAEGFGVGMGTFSTCGAVTGMAMVIGMMLSDGDMDNPKTKSICRKKMKEASLRFTEKNKSTICREIKGMDGGEVLRSCSGCIDDAIEILEELFPETTTSC